MVIYPEYHKNKQFVEFRERVGQAIKDLYRQWGIDFIEGNLAQDHIHMCLRVIPKNSITFVTEFLKVKSAVRIQRNLFGYKKFAGLPFCSCVYCVSTFGLEEKTRRNYVRDQEKVES